MPTKKFTLEQSQALHRFAQRVEKLSICEYYSGRLVGFVERPRRGDGETSDVRRWKKLEESWTELIELGMIPGPAVLY